MNNVSKRRALGAVAGFSAIALALGTAMPANAADEQLKVGAILPLTGALAFLNPPMIAGFWAAVDEINAEGGVLGQDIKVTGIKDEGYGGTTPAYAGQAATEHIALGTQVILGAASSGRSLSIVAQTSGAKIIQISPSNTDISLTSVDDNGYYFRTAPSDLLQGRVLGNKVLADGKKNVAIIYMQDPYGTGLANTAAATLTKGGAKVKKYAFSMTAKNFTSVATSVKAQGADAVVIVSYDQIFDIAPALKAKGIDGSSLFLVDGNFKNFAAAKSTFATWIKGSQATSAGAPPTASFAAALKAAYRAHEKKSLPGDETLYGPEAYDAIVISALAAIEAKSTKAEDIKAHMASVTKGGTKVKTFKAAVAALKAGKDIDYEGQSGPVEFDSKGNPSKAYMNIFKYDAKGTASLFKSYLTAVPTK